MHGTLPISNILYVVGARGSVVDLRHYATIRRVAGSIPHVVGLFN
jgi:hypothetical protein